MKNQKQKKNRFISSKVMKGKSIGGLSLMEIGDSSAIYESHVITSFEKNISEVIDLSMGIQAPAYLASESMKNKTGRVRPLLKKLNEATDEEKERFLDSLLEFISSKMTKDDLSKFIKKMDSIEGLGRLLGTFRRNVEQFNQEERIEIIKEGMTEIFSKFAELHEFLGKEIIEADSFENFNYLLLCQTIIHRAIFCLSQVEDELLKKDEITKGKLLSISIVSILRIEAFRRGKISLSDLHDAYTDLMLICPFKELTIPIRSPDWST